MIAHDLADLHGDTIELARLGSNLNKMTALTEKGEIVPGLSENPKCPGPGCNEHEMLTGSQPDGRAFMDSADHTCSNWTSNTDGVAIGTNSWEEAEIGFSRSQRRQQWKLELVASDQRLQPEGSPGHSWRGQILLLCRELGHSPRRSKSD